MNSISDIKVYKSTDIPNNIYQSILTKNSF